MTGFHGCWKFRERRFSRVAHRRSSTQNCIYGGRGHDLGTKFINLDIRLKRSGPVAPYINFSFYSE